MNARTITKRIHTARVNAERGATAVEYGLMVALIAVAIVAGVSVLGQALSGMFAGIAANPVVW